MEETAPPQSVEQHAKQNRADLLKKLSPSLLMAGFFGFFLSVTGAGFMVIYIIIPQVILIPIRLYKGIMKADERWLNFGRAIVWMAVIAAIYLVHHVREEINRRYADEMVARLEAYGASHRKCAARIEDVGISAQELHDRLGYSGYLCEDGKQHLFYRGSFMPFSSWHYDFERRSWGYRPD